jgi:glycosyltransferase involved in cell wall biosynthesis
VSDGPTVGLALIARDEETTLPHLLGSIEGAFDQVVLLDTGSTDGTADVFVEWAEGQLLPLGYTVDRFEWCDDFAAARNAADELLATDWLAWADCDDWIVGAGELRRIAREAPADVTHALFLYGFAQTGEPCDLTGCHYRLFRRGYGSWQRPVHEMKHLVAAGRAMDVSAEICHWRTSRHGWREGSAKRNRRIARRWVDRDPASLCALYCAAREELLFARADEGNGPWLDDADVERGMQYAIRFLSLVAEQGLLGPYGLRMAQRALGEFHRDNDPSLNAGLFKIALHDPAGWPQATRRSVLDQQPGPGIESLGTRNGAGVRKHPAPGTGGLSSGASRNLHAPLASSLPRRCDTTKEAR